tara:strand:- start:191378 stop:191953 length:576 start_codon:yes stop_codon:yes gene_type:complete
MKTLVIISKEHGINISMQTNAMTAVNLIKSFEQDVPAGSLKRELQKMKQSIINEAQYTKVENTDAEYVVAFDEFPARANYEMILSDKNIPLMVARKDCKSIITVEKSQRWGTLVVVHPDGTQERVSPEKMGKFHKDSLTTDQGCFNPRAVQAYSLATGYALDILAYEAICGRWLNRSRKVELETLDLIEAY